MNVIHAYGIEEYDNDINVLASINRVIPTSINGHIIIDAQDNMSANKCNIIYYDCNEHRCLLIIDNSEEYVMSVSGEHDKYIIIDKGEYIEVMYNINMQLRHECNIRMPPITDYDDYLFPLFESHQLGRVVPFRMYHTDDYMIIAIDIMNLDRQYVSSKLHYYDVKLGTCNYIMEASAISGIITHGNWFMVTAFNPTIDDNHYAGGSCLAKINMKHGLPTVDLITHSNSDDYRVFAGTQGGYLGKRSEDGQDVELHIYNEDGSIAEHMPGYRGILTSRNQPAVCRDPDTFYECIFDNECVSINQRTKDGLIYIDTICGFMGKPRIAEDGRHCLLYLYDDEKIIMYDLRNRHSGLIWHIDDLKKSIP